MPRPRCCTQARNLGFASAAVLAQLEAAPLLRRLDLASDKVLRTRGALAPRDDVARGAGGTRHGALGFLDLPHAVALHILSFVPADARARSALVYRAWRATVADASLWTVLDLSCASGVAQPVSDATLRGAAALARGGLTSLCLDYCDELTDEARLEVVTANAGSLRKLSCLFATITGPHVEELAAAAPQLVAFKVDVNESVAEATRMLRNEAPFGALVLRLLSVHYFSDEESSDEEDDDVAETRLLAFCSALSAHASLEVLELCNRLPNAPAVMDALSAAALACKLHVLEFSGCDLSQACVPALARLIRGGVLETLLIDNDPDLDFATDPLLDEAAAMQLADALAESRALTRLKLETTRFWDDAHVAATVMRALTGHPSLQEVDLSWNDPPDELTAGAALGALLAANAPALQTLDVSCSSLGDVGLGGLCDALPRNTHLRELKLNKTGMSAEFLRSTFLPAVHANTSLRQLDASRYWSLEFGGQPPPELLEAEALVTARSNGDR